MSRKNTLKTLWQIPWTLVYTWSHVSDEAKINIIDYNEKTTTHEHVRDAKEIHSFKKNQTRWIDLVGVDQVETIQEIGDHLKIHPLILEDIVNIQQRPKIEEIDDEYIFVSLKMFNYSKDAKTGNGTLTEEQISLVLGKNYVISFQEKEGDDFDHIKERIKKGKWRIRKMKADYLAYSIVDAIVDNYFLVLEHIADEVEIVESELLKNPSPTTLSKIQKIKQNLIILRKSIRPVREIVNVFQRTDSDLISDELGTYFRDLYDHTIQVIDSIETFRDIVSGSLDIYLSSISNKMNEIMKVLTIIGTIFIPLTFIVGVYGMNFKYMPELDQTWSYPLLWIIMIGIVVGMFVYFRRKKWI